MDVKKDEKVRITISLPNELLEKVDKHANESYQNRSNWIVQVIVEKIKSLET